RTHSCDALGEQRDQRKQDNPDGNNRCVRLERRTDYVREAADTKVLHAVTHEMWDRAIRLIDVPRPRSKLTLHLDAHVVLLGQVAQHGVAKLRTRTESGEEQLRETWRCGDHRPSGAGEPKSVQTDAAKRRARSNASRPAAVTRNCRRERPP